MYFKFVSLLTRNHTLHFASLHERASNILPTLNIITEMVNWKPAKLTNMCYAEWNLVYWLIGKAGCVSCLIL